ncbi:RMtype1_S_EcoKI-TRD2-CR2_like domain containing protein [Comamonadaceae bacterium]
MLLSNLNLLAQAPGGVARLRELVLTLAVQGKLVPQDPKDEPASELLKKIRVEKDRLIAEGKIKRDKPLAEIAEEEKPFELPQGWEWVRVSQISARVQYGFTASADHSVAQPKFLRITDIQNDQVNWDTVPGVQAGSQDISSYFLADGDLLIARTGGTIGKSFLVDVVPVDSVFASYLIRISPLPGFTPQYLKTFASSGHYWSQVLAKSMGTGQPNVNGTALSELVLALPPLAEQSRIVTRVEELLRLCDALEAKGQLEATQHAQLVNTLLATLTDSETPAQLAHNWHRIATHFDLLLDRPEAVDALEQTILQLAVRGLLVPQDPQDESASELLKKIRAEKDKLIAEGKFKRDKPLPPISEDEQPYVLPVGWEWARFGQIANIASNLVPPALHAKKWQVAPDCIEKASGRLLERRTVAQAEIISPNHLFKPGQILYSKIRPSLSKAVLVDFEGLCSADMYPIESSLDSEYLLMYMLSQPFLEQVSIAENRVKMPKLNQEALVAFTVAVPPLAEQSRIVTRVAQLRRLCADLRQRLTIARTQQALLAEVLASTI